MLAKKYRFHGHGSVRRVYRTGRLARSRLVTLRCVHNPHRVHSRVAVVVSKKITKSAPARNRIRRRIYEVIRTHWGDIKQPQDIVLTVQSAEFLVLTHEQVVNEIMSILGSAYLTREQTRPAASKKPL